MEKAKEGFNLVDGVNVCSNQQYHSDRKYLSSSVLKTVYKSLDTYYNEYVLGNKKEISKETQSIFDYGTLCHSYILEPDTVEKDFNFYPGFRKQGKDFEEFLNALDNPQLPVISASQHSQVKELIQAYKSHPAAPKLIEGGFPEHTVCGELHGVPIKVRADYINIDKGYIVDVKTTGYSSEKDSFSMTIDGLMYHLSAALYSLMMEKQYGKKFDFYFIVLSKKTKMCDVYKLSEERMELGRRIVQEACSKYKKAKETDTWTDFFEKERSFENYEIEEI